MSEGMQRNCMITALIIIAALVAGYTSYYITKTPDSPIEEIAETVIENELGFPEGTIDLSPDGEKK